MERADGLLRTTSTHHILSLDNVGLASTSWRPVLEVFTTLSSVEISVLEHDSSSSLHTLLSDDNNSNSLKVIVMRARENARGAQDHITKEVWENINALYHLINQSSHHIKSNDQDRMQQMHLYAQQSLLYTGVADITMPRSIGWSFMNLGKLTERCIETIVIADKHYELIDYNIDEEKAIIQWKELLFALSGYELHLKTYRETKYNRNVLHQVLFNENFPHAVLYSLTRIEKYLDNIARENHSPGNKDLQRSLGRLVSRVKYMDEKNITSKNLHQFLEEIRTELVQFNQQLSQNFFSYQ